METNIQMTTSMVTMGYRIMKCKICEHPVHAHRKGSRYVLKNLCEHIKVDTSISERDFYKYFKRGA